MKTEHHPGADNIGVLRQGIDLIQALDETVFSGEVDGLWVGGIGSQFRHCIDFYFSFLRGIEDGVIDYNHRDRDPDVESDRSRAEASMRSIAERLEALTPELASKEVQVRMESAAEGGEGPGSHRSSLGRELQFLLSHTIHHYALIVTLLRLQGVTLGAEFSKFGIAPSTLRYWEETATVAG